MGEIRNRAGDAKSTVHQAIENSPGPAGIRSSSQWVGEESRRSLVCCAIKTKPERRSLSDAMGERVRRMIMIMIITDVTEWYLQAERKRDGDLSERNRRLWR